MNLFLRLACRCGGVCKGGIRCPADTPRPTSAAGQRRRTRVKARSRRGARAALRAADVRGRD